MLSGPICHMVPRRKVILAASVVSVAALALLAFGGGHPTILDAQTAQLVGHDLEPAPINPAWILSGTPVARAKTLMVTSDQGFSSTIWECSAGSFRWHHRSDEIVHILEGEVDVEVRANEVRTLRPGDVALFPRGSSGVWRVPRYVKKIAHHRSPEQGLVRRAVNRAKKLF
jgi:uncharacterized cupin superfamily protein